MIRDERAIVIDIDGTICAHRTDANERYEDLLPNPDVVDVLRRYKGEGFYIILSTSRNMKTHNGNVGLITARTAKSLMQWLDKHEIPYDELHVGKPWPGQGGFYVDDKAIRPDEFVTLSYEEILDIVGF